MKVETIDGMDEQHQSNVHQKKQRKEIANRKCINEYCSNFAVPPNPSVGSY